MENLDRKLWARVCAIVLERDGDCTARNEDGTPCSPGALHCHHLIPVYDPYDPDGVIAVCAAHHRRLEVLSRRNLERLESVLSSR